MNYIIVPSEHLDKVDFSKVKQTSPNSLRYSLDKKHFILKYEDEQPEFVYSITNDAIGLQEHKHEKILQILTTPEWNSQG
tara:strand:+ start:38 stop:277 length:240 start_codon:yes stop_codon:yes gene_type:complete